MWSLRLNCYAIKSVSTFCVVPLLDMVVDTFQQAFQNLQLRYIFKPVLTQFNKTLVILVSRYVTR